MSKLYYTIGEVASLLNENSSTLRFWEKEFPNLRPTKNAKGDRRYTESDIELLRRIQQLTRDAGYTLDGAREQLRHGFKSASIGNQLELTGLSNPTDTASDSNKPTPSNNNDSVRSNVIATLRQVREELVKLSEKF